MRDGSPTPQINMSKIPGGGGIAGAMVAILSTLIFLFGIPRLWYFLPAAIALGCVVALIMRLIRHETPGKPWILSDTKEEDSASSAAQTQRNHGQMPGNIRRAFQELPTRVAVKAT